MLDLFAAFLDHPRSIFGGHWCANFGCNCSSFNNILHVWLENAHSRPKISFGDFTTQMERCINRTPKKHILAWKDVI